MEIIFIYVMMGKDTLVYGGKIYYSEKSRGLIANFLKKIGIRILDITVFSCKKRRLHA